VLPKIDERFAKIYRTDQVKNNDSNERLEQEEKQREKIKNYLDENYPNSAWELQNISAIALEIAKYLYPDMSIVEQKSKKKSIRVELTNMRNNKHRRRKL
jgi:hypothetical protein